MWQKPVVVCKTQSFERSDLIAWKRVKPFDRFKEVSSSPFLKSVFDAAHIHTDADDLRHLGTT
jgi:hypothetical protein